MSYSNGDKKYQTDVESAARDVAAQIRALQNEALTGKQVGGSYVHEFWFDIVNNSYTISYKDGAGNVIGSEVPVDFTKKRVTFGSTDIKFAFTSPLARAYSVQTITVNSTVPGSTAAAYICISADGVITDQASSCT